MGRLHALIGGFAGVCAVGLAAAYLVPLPERLYEPASTVVEWSDGSAAYVSLSPDSKWRIAADLERIDPAFVEALIALEDKRFESHLGVDSIAIARAIRSNVFKRRRVSGASTITMQVVRVLEPRPRNLRSKVTEAMRATQLELHMSKDEILAAYLTFIPYGRNIEGVEAASLAYFGHAADHLSPSEIATLLAVPQAPNRRYPSADNADRLEAARNDIAARLFEDDQEMVREARTPSQLHPFPRQAPHAAAWLRARHPGITRIRSTLDSGVQRIAERTLRQHYARMERQAVYNGAIVVADHRTGEVAALVGGFDFYDDDHGAQIPAFAVPRSPGSALKPFLFAFAIERGVAGEGYLVPDVPSSYGGYAPKNYDGQWSGLVRLDDALSKSLNLPFVELLQHVGVEPFVRNLRAMGADSVYEDPSYYGLSAAVGGIEMTPLELTELYVTLAAQGQWRELAVNRDDARSEPQQMIAPGAVWLTRRVLERKDRPDFPRRREMTDIPASIHWKTGTSFGHHDALAAGSGTTYTATVWLGNLDYSPSSSLVGASAAGPILFDVLEGLEPRSVAPRVVAMPDDLHEVKVCAWSGRIATHACPERATALAIGSRVPTQRCGFHVQFDVDVSTGEALTPACRTGREWETQTFAVRPASVRRWMTDHGRAVTRLPTHATGCERIDNEPPRIVSPAHRTVLMLIDGVPTDRQRVPLEAEVVSTSKQLDWFVNGEFLGTAPADGRMWWTPSAGLHEIVVSDDSGLSSRRSFEVRHRM